jgi:hypothetical protein
MVAVTPALNATATVAKAAAKEGSMGLTGIAVAVLSSAVNKSAGATNRYNDVKNEPKYVQDYVVRRELLNIGLAMGSNALVQTLFHKPISSMLKGRVPEGYVRMMLTAPGLYLCEFLSRQMAGKEEVEARQSRDRQGVQSIIRRAPNVSFAAFQPSTPSSTASVGVGFQATA